MAKYGKTRNHVTFIGKADGVAKGTEDVEKSAKADKAQQDPDNADQLVSDNVVGPGEVDGNGSGVRAAQNRAAKAKHDAAKEAFKQGKEDAKATRKEGRGNPNT